MKEERLFVERDWYSTCITLMHAAHGTYHVMNHDPAAEIVGLAPVDGPSPEART